MLQIKFVYFQNTKFNKKNHSRRKNNMFADWLLTKP